MSTTTTFEAHGHLWQIHTPGDPMPCDGSEKVFILPRDRHQVSCCYHADEISWVHQGTWMEITGWRYADAAPPQEKDELTRLREENASMRTAIKEGHTALEKVYLAYCSTTADVEDCGIDNIARDALATISPFTQPQ